MKKIIHNVETDEIIERDFTPQELQQIEKDQAELLRLKNQEIEATTKRQALLNKLGITEEEARLLLS
jgi:hypothetical protein